jgi:hypothetical protein
MCSGINLVPNGDFESYTNCPYADSQFNFAWPWFIPTDGTSDYFNSCGGPGSPVSTPTNVVGVRTPLSGQAYAGAFVYGTNFGNSYREYLEVPLTSPLVAGQQYRVSFNVSRSPFYGYAVAEIGARLSTGPIVSNIYTGVLNVVPQVVNPSTNVITSTTNWTLIQGVFTAIGGENYLTLGNFRPDPLTTTTFIGGFDGSHSYYYVDDVAVTPICPSSVTNKIVACGAPIIFDPPIPFDNCSGTNVIVTVASTTTNGICPKVVTRTWSLTDLCGNSNTWSQSVSLSDTNPPIVFCSPTNLVPNPQFETFALCPTNLSMLNVAAPWYRPTFATPDYFNTCAASNSFVSVPANFVGNQTPYTGQGYAGGYVYSVNGGNDTNACYREYLQVPLLSPLVAGRTYSVSFRVSLADTVGWAISEIGAYLSVNPVTNFSYQGPLPVVPQIVNPSGNLLTSTNSWMLVQGLFTAVGGEKYLTIGNFLTDSATTAVPAGGPEVGFSYYYYEDVHVESACTGFATEKTIPCGAPLVFDTVTGYDACSGTNITTTISTVTNSTCPLIVTRMWTLTDFCNNSTNLSQTIFVTNNSAITINCACLQDSILSLLTTNGCSGIIPNLSLLTNSPCISGGNTNCGPLQFSQSPPAGTIVGPGIHNVTVGFSRCSGASNGCVLPFYVYSPPPVVICPPNLHLLTCFSGIVAYFTPIVFGNVGTVVCSPPSGSVFPLGTTTVTCTATNGCGVAASCTFTVNVRQIITRWGCVIIVIGIPTDPIGGGTVSYIPALAGGGNGVDLGNFGSTGQDGMRFQFGPAPKFTFSTVLDFNAPDGARINLSLPDVNGGPSTRLLSFIRSCQPHCGWNLDLSPQIVEGTTATLRSIAIGTNGELFSSFTQSIASLGTSAPLSLTAMNGATSAVMTVSLDCRTRELTLDFPLCSWTPDAARKGWDGCIYGNALRGGSTTNKNARLILTPLTSTTPAPITNLDLTASNLTQVAFDNPSITAFGRKWGDGHVTLIKAYDDGEAGVEFFAAGDGGGPTVDLGHAAAFQFRVGHFENGDIPTAEQLYSIRGWPPGPLTNRPAPPPILLRLVQASNSVDCSADFSTLDVSNVTLQLWNGTSLVSQKDHVAASLSNSIATLSTAPVILGSPGLGVLSLAHTNPFTVLSGLDCTVCQGTELRILPELSPAQPAPVVYTELQSQVSEGLDLLFYRLQRTLACVPGPLTVTRVSDGIILEWSDDKFRLEGAETLAGPWYDLGVASPVTLSSNASLRFFRLVCD